MTSRTHGARADDGLQKEFRRAWSRFATGVTLITTNEPGGGVHGMTANGVTSVSLTPPLALACVGHERNTHRLIEANGRFGISILAADQAHVASHYALPPERRGGAVRFGFTKLGETPVLEGALAAMECRVVAAHEAGDHTIFVAGVERVQANEGQPLLWYAGVFGDFAPRPAGAESAGAPARR